MSTAERRRPWNCAHAGVARSQVPGDIPQRVPRPRQCRTAGDSSSQHPTTSRTGVGPAPLLSIWTLGRLTVRGRPSRMVVRQMDYAELLQQVQTAAAVDWGTAQTGGLGTGRTR